jgi:ornithine carrier protein
MLNFHPPTAPGRIPRRAVPAIPSSSSTSHKPLPTGRASLHHSAASRSAAVETLRPPGPIALIRSIVDSYGVRGLWLGHTGTLVRETGGTAAWFVAKEWVARQLIARRIHQSPYTTTSDGAKIPRTAANTELLPWESAFSGAIAGAFGALVFYPADTVKSAIQTEEELRPRVGPASGAYRAPSSSFLGTFKLMWVKHGLKGLYAGCGMTVARAVPSSGIIFVVYDGLTAYFS